MGLMRCPVRTLNMGRVERGRGTSRLAAMCLSSIVSPWMVVWWKSWMLRGKDTWVLCPEVPPVSLRGGGLRGL